MRKERGVLQLIRWAWWIDKHASIIAQYLTRIRPLQCQYQIKSEKEPEEWVSFGETWKVEHSSRLKNKRMTCWNRNRWLVRTMSSFDDAMRSSLFLRSSVTRRSKKRNIHLPRKCAHLRRHFTCFEALLSLSLIAFFERIFDTNWACLLYTSPSPRD